MSKEDLKVKPLEQDVKEEDLKQVKGGSGCVRVEERCLPVSCMCD